MSERERALHALAGRRFPRVGGIGEYITSTAPGFTLARESVVVTDLSRDGHVVTVRFFGRDAVRLHGAFRVLRRYSDDGAGGYGSPAPGKPEIMACWVQF